MADKFIDIDKIIAEKNPRLKKWLPKFIVRYLKLTLHEEEVNAALDESEGLSGYEFSKKIIQHFNITVKIEGIENIPKTGGAIFACNHPLGGFDALAVIQEIYPIRPDMKFVVNDILLSLPNLKDMFQGVNKHGTNSKESLEDLNKLFESDRAIFVFPAGLVSRRSNWVVEDLEWMKTFITRSKKFERDVIPVYIDGKLSNFFYGLSNIRKFLRIPANFEMLYLVDELFKQRNKTITIRFGKPIAYTTFDKTKKDPEWADWVKHKVYEMRTKSPAGKA